MSTETKRVVGWREWVDLNDLNLPHVKAKVDTGAKTSCLHAFKVKPVEKDGQPWVRFWVHPNQDDLETVVVCESPVVDRREVTDSGGHTSNRYVIRALVSIGGVQVPIDLTLTNRDTMRFRMLLGRNALSKRFVVDVDQSFCLGGNDGQPPAQHLASDEEE